MSDPVLFDPTPLTQAPAAIRLHVALALCALLLGPLALLRRQRDLWHRVAGAGFAGALAGAAVSSFWIAEAQTFGPFSVIHVLSVLALVGLVQGLGALWLGRARAHGFAMRALYLQALVLPGMLTFLPGRRMNAVLFGAAPVAGFVLVAALGTALAVWVWRGNSQPDGVRKGLFKRGRSR